MQAGVLSPYYETLKEECLWELDMEAFPTQRQDGTDLCIHHYPATPISDANPYHLP